MKRKRLYLQDVRFESYLSCLLFFPLFLYLSFQKCLVPESYVRSWVETRNTIIGAENSLWLDNPWWNMKIYTNTFVKNISTILYCNKWIIRHVKCSSRYVIKYTFFRNYLLVPHQTVWAKFYFIFFSVLYHTSLCSTSRSFIRYFSMLKVPRIYVIVYTLNSIHIEKCLIGILFSSLIDQ